MIRSVRNVVGRQVIRSNTVDTAVGIFVNGITGVFIGITLLYLTMKLIAFVSAMGAGPDKTE